VIRSASEIIDELGMEPIPQEGAWLVQGPRVPGLSTIRALLADTPEGFSAMHRLEIDEGWQWLDGAPLRMLRLAPEGTLTRTTLDAGHPQLVVPRGTWQGARTLGNWTLIACWCAPAFELEYFTLGDRTALVGAYPDAADDIAALTRQAP
jgi:predicted cupin superfamily sugar epimerase